MFDLLIVAQSAPSTQSITLLQLVVGFVSVIVTVVLATAGLAWRAGRTLATKEDLKPMDGMVTKDDLDAFKAENERAHQGIIESVKENHRRFDAVDTKLSSVAKEVAFTAGRQYERDHGRRSESSPYAGMSEH